MSLKAKKIAGMVEQWAGHGSNPHLAGYLACFNRGEFYEAHDVLEQLWLPARHGANGSFYKGLIQLAGAFVHLQKNRLRPSAALFKLAVANLQKYPLHHERLDMVLIRELITQWLGHLENDGFRTNPLTANPAPRLDFLDEAPPASTSQSSLSSEP